MKWAYLDSKFWMNDAHFVSTYFMAYLLHYFYNLKTNCDRMNLIVDLEFCYIELWRIFLNFY